MANPALFSLEVLENGTPSRRDGMSLEQERREREKLCSYIESLRKHLRMCVSRRMRSCAGRGGGAGRGRPVGGRRGPADAVPAALGHAGDRGL